MTHVTLPQLGTFQVAESVTDVRLFVASAKRHGLSVAFVPTMGALHAGHVSLIERAQSECGCVIVSIFVNPQQFGPNEDFSRYPRPRELDIEICRRAGAQLVFYPAVETMYPAGFQTFVEVAGISDILEGRTRPGHFRGVATIVTKLLLTVQAERAYFGQKDYQQQTLIRIMARELGFPTEIITCETMRDSDGLAMSSRNAYLNPTERKAGLCLFQALRIAKQRVLQREQSIGEIRTAMRQHVEATPGAELDYAVIVNPNTLVELIHVEPQMVALIAARFGSTRLIDNIVLETPGS